MKVCLVLPCVGIEMRGGPRSFLETIDILKQEGVECFVLMPGYGPLEDELSRRGVPVCVIPYKAWIDNPNIGRRARLRKLLKNLAMTPRIAVKIMRWQCDIVYTNTISVGVGAFAAALLGRPHVWHIREFIYEDHGQVFDLGRELTLRLVDRLSQVCIVNSKAVAQKYQQFITPSKLQVVYQAVNFAPNRLTVTQPAPNHFRCVIVGAIAEGKRQEDAIRAIADLMQMGIKAELYIVGNGDLRYHQYLQTIVTQNNLEKYVTFIGYVENAFGYMQSADVVLVCSRCEAFGRVTIEGMRVGKPVVGAKSGGTQELIQDGFNGFLYPVGDHKELAQKIRYLYEHPAEAKQMGENGRQWAAKLFSQELYGKEIYMLLSSLVGDTSS